MTHAGQLFASKVCKRQNFEEDRFWKCTFAGAASKRHHVRNRSGQTHHFHCFRNEISWVFRPGWISFSSKFSHSLLYRFPRKVVQSNLLSLSNCAITIKPCKQEQSSLKNRLASRWHSSCLQVEVFISRSLMIVITSKLYNMHPMNLVEVWPHYSGSALFWTKWLTLPEFTWIDQIICLPLKLVWSFWTWNSCVFRKLI